jgi:gamma-glutamyltranspeptidase/glutathione hydrolase
MDSVDFQFNAHRSPVLGRSGMVATSQPLAVQAGLEILIKGGNAADSAVATAAALAVTEPTSTGIGGDCFALYYDAKTMEITALNGSGRAPSALSLEVLASQGFTEDLPAYHPHTITVPGACRGWIDLIARHGSLHMETVLAPAIQLAEDGFPVAPLTAYFWERGVEHQLSTSLGGSELTIDGRAPRPGELFRNPGLAKTMRRVAHSGAGAFYEGEIAEAIVNTVQKSGGLLSMEDLGRHKSDWVDPISTVFHGLRIWECPLNGQGLTVLLALNILENFDLDSLPALGSNRLHLIIESLKLAFADARWYIADPEFFAAPVDELLSKEYAKVRSREIDPTTAFSNPTHGSPVQSSDTVYLTVVDREGNACSFINSNYMGFGTGIVPAGWGFSLQNRGMNFSLDPDHPNALAPGKRPYHTIIPAMATREDGSLYASFGVMGGFMQPQGHVQVILGLLTDSLNPQEALNRPRVYLWGGDPGGIVALEQGIAMDVMEDLSHMGHTVELVRGVQRAIFGRGQIIFKDPTSGVYWGGSDPRADGNVGVIL